MGEVTIYGFVLMDWGVLVCLFGVQGLALRVWGVEFGVEGSGCRRWSICLLSSSSLPSSLELSDTKVYEP